MKKRKSNKAKRYCNSCKNNGSCSYCYTNRMYAVLKALLKSEKDLEEYFETVSKEWPTTK